LILVDINIALPAHRGEHPDHSIAREWLIGTLRSGASIGLTDATISGLARIATNQRIFDDPATTEQIVEYVDYLIAAGAGVITAGPRHWSIFRDLMERAKATGDLVTDAHLAAIALEHGARIATRDRDFARFPGVDWFDPLD
jgi:toxin-antitoxin system PIN domain toxin